MDTLPRPAIDEPRDGDTRAAWLQELRAWNTPTDRVMLDPAAALAAGRLAVAQAEHLAWPEAIALAHLLIGGAYGFQTAIADAEHHLTVALEHFRALGDDWGQAMVVLRLHLVWVPQGRRVHAIRELTNALDLAEHLDPPDESLTIGLLGDLANEYADNGQANEALLLGIRAHERAIAFGDLSCLATVELNLALYYLDQYDFDHARVALLDVRRLIAAHPHLEPLLPPCLTNLAAIEEDRDDGDLLLAISYLNQSIALEERMGNLVESGRSYADLGRIHSRLGHRDMAIAALRQAFAIWKAADHPDHHTDQLLARYRLEMLTGTTSMETRERLAATLEREDSDIAPVQIDVLDALTDITERQGDLVGALAYARRARSQSERHLNEMSAIKLQRVAKEFQTAEAQRIAATERAQREELQVAMAQIMRLNGQNEEMVRELKKKSAALDELARTDPLTGLGNRRLFDERLQQEVARAISFARPLAIGMLDLDGFKHINDEHSHLVGDDVLRAIGRIVHTSIRTTDVGARFGGDEFALILTEASPDAASRVATRIHQGIADFDWSTIAPGLSITASIGMTTLAAPMGTPDPTPAHLLREADDLLYEAKLRGKNQTALG